MRPVLPGKPIEHLPVHAVWPATRNLQPKIRVVVDELVARCAPLA